MASVTEAPLDPVNTGARAAAGVLLIRGGKVLLLQRGAQGDHAGEWAFPGGGIEAGETPIEAALRELWEETGIRLAPEQVQEHARTIRDGLEFTTFLSATDEAEPDVQLNHEHGAFMWATPDERPANLHPGVAAPLAKLGMNELQVAEAIRDGHLASPVRYMNMWLFDLRITGTGAAYRSSKDEFAYRDPKHYLNDEMLRRSNGLVVVWYHPETPMLNTTEFLNRVVGSVMLPYIKGDEVWGVSKIYDANAASLMSKMQLSTSPGVILGGPTAGRHILLPDGTKVLVENPPALLDHLAICEVGVWDKAEAPQGVNITGDKLVADETEEERKAREAKDRKDADAGTQLDKLLSHMDGMSKRFDEQCAKMDARLDRMDARMDSAEKDRKDRKDEGGKEMGEAERLAADKAKKDADEKAEKDRKDAAEAELAEREKADKAKKDAEDRERHDAELRALKDSNEAMKAKLDEIDTKVASRPADEERAMTDAQARCDSVATLFGSRAPRFLPGESASAYRRRLAEPFKEHSADWKGVDLATVDGALLDVAERSIYDAAMREGKNPSRGSADKLEMVTMLSSGHEIHEFHGSPRSWMDSLAGGTRQHVVSIAQPNLGA